MSKHSSATKHATERRTTSGPESGARRRRPTAANRGAADRPIPLVPSVPAAEADQLREALHLERNGAESSSKLLSEICTALDCKDDEIASEIECLQGNLAAAEEELAEIRKRLGLAGGCAHAAVLQELTNLRDVGPRSKDAMGLRDAGKSTMEEIERPILAWLLRAGELDTFKDPSDETTVALLTRLFTFGNGSPARGAMQVATHFAEVFRWAVQAGEFGTCDGLGADAWTGATWFIEQYLETARVLDWRIERAEEFRRKGATP